MMFCCFCFILPVCALVVLLRILLSCRQRHQSKSGSRSVAFFHPYCNAGGGGERVLWCMIRTLQTKYPNLSYYVYTGDVDVEPDKILENARNRFNVEICKDNVRFIFLKHRWLVEAEYYPRFTLIGQSLGGLFLGFEALWKFVPDVFLDSMGYAMTLPLFRFMGGCLVGCYVHYPTISTDMIGKVESREENYNNPSNVSRSVVLTKAKLLYYKLFAVLYGLVGSAAHIVIVNSTWTKKHIVDLWNCPERTNIAYPPCDVAHFTEISNVSERHLSSDNWVRILSIGQFRPEKNHKLQLEVLHNALNRVKLSAGTANVNLQLVLVGSCRHEQDMERCRQLQEDARRLNIDDFIEWKLNISFAELKDQLSSALIGIHTMWNEHFGIGIVEGMAAGNIMIANKSGGPKSDIVVPSDGDERVGFLASDVEEYAAAITDIISMTPEQRNDIRFRAREHVQKFSEDSFAVSCLESLERIL